MAQKMQINVELIDRLSANMGRMAESMNKFEKSVQKVTTAIKTSAKQSSRYSEEGRKMRMTTEGLRFKIGQLRNTLLLLTFAYQTVRRVILPAIKAAMEQEKQEKKLQIALKNTMSGYIGATQDLIIYAGELQKLTTFGDEEIISLMALGGTFKLTAEQIKKVIPRILDMTVAMQKMGKAESDSQAIGIAVYKALVGQMGVLSRYGVVIDDATMKSKDFNKILLAMDGNFQGMAEGLRTTSIGAVQAFGKAVSDLSEQLGEKMKTDTGVLGFYFKAVVALTEYLKRNTEREKLENRVNKILGIQINLSRERYEAFLKEEEAKAVASKTFKNFVKNSLDSFMIFNKELQIANKVATTYEEWRKLLLELDEERTKSNAIHQSSLRQLGEETAEYKKFNAVLAELQESYFNETEGYEKRRKSVEDYNKKFEETTKLLDQWDIAYKGTIKAFVEETEKASSRIQEIWGITRTNEQTAWKKWYEGHTKFVTKQATSLATSTHTMWKTFFFDAMTGELKTLEDYFRDFGRSVLSILSDVIARLLLAKALGGLPGIWGAAFSGLVTVGGGGGATDPGSGPSPSGGIHHTGGPIKPRRFANGGGIPILAESGEGVINREGMRSFGLENLNRINRGESAEGGGTTNIYNIVAMDALSFQEYLRQNGGGVIEDTMSNAMLSNKPFRNIARQSL